MGIIEQKRSSCRSWKVSHQYKISIARGRLLACNTKNRHHEGLAKLKRVFPRLASPDHFRPRSLSPICRFSYQHV